MPMEQEELGEDVPWESELEKESEPVVSQDDEHQEEIGVVSFSCLFRVVLKAYPKPAFEIDDNLQLTIGDLHGNALKLFWWLCHAGVFNLPSAEPDAEYRNFVDLYEKPVESVSAKDIEQFDRLIEQVNVKKVALIRLIGDEMADRGSNDYFTLKILDKLFSSGVAVEILLSNHSVQFLETMRLQCWNEPIYHTRKSMACSLAGFSYLVQKKLVDEQVVRQMAAEYFKRVKALSYSIDIRTEPPTMHLYTHAPVGLETVEAAAKRLGVSYAAATMQQLAHTIDEINRRLPHYINGAFLAKEYYFSKNKSLSTRFPFVRLMWNRVSEDYEERLRTGSIEHGIYLPLKLEDETALILNHGHEGQSSRAHLEYIHSLRQKIGRELPVVARDPAVHYLGDSFAINAVNLDCDIGKGAQDNGEPGILLQREDSHVIAPLNDATIRERKESVSNNRFAYFSSASVSPKVVSCSEEHSDEAPVMVVA